MNHSKDAAVTVKSALRQASQQLKKAKITNPQLDARVLLADVLGVTHAWLIAEYMQPLSVEIQKAYQRRVERRMQGEPVSRIMGRREFWGLEFAVSPHTLDPRPESECVVQAVLNYVRLHNLELKPLRVLDLGTGSGCLLAAVLSELPEATGVGVDISEEAISIARKNIQTLGLHPKASFLCSNWASALSEASFDIIVCNPPYISRVEFSELSNDVRDYDPALALYGGVDGLECYRQLIPQAVSTLKSSGFLALEIGENQSFTVSEILRQLGENQHLRAPTTLLDLAGKSRVVATERQSV